jgi:hypothetical protein
MSSTQATPGYGRACMTYADEASGVRFVWHGGAYIDVDGMDCINVWNYERDVPTIPRTLEAFEARCRDWIAAADYPPCDVCGDPIDYCQGHGA